MTSPAQSLKELIDTVEKVAVGECTETKLVTEAVNWAKDHAQSLLEDNERYRKALEFYAERKHFYKGDTFPDETFIHCGDSWNGNYIECGSVAFAALNPPTEGGV